MVYVITILRGMVYMIKAKRLFLLSCLYLFSQPTQAATFYVNPNQSLSAAVSKLYPGDTLILREGTYRETIQLPKRSWSKDLKTTIRGEAGKTVVVKASNVVSGWTAQANGVWTKPWTTSSQQVFVNGQSLQQIGGDIFGDYPTNPNHSLASLHTHNGGIWPGRVSGDANNLVVNSFYWNKSTKVLYVKVQNGLNLNQQTVEVSVRSYLLNGEGIQGLTLTHIQFAHGNVSSLSRGGVVRLYNSNYNHLHDIQVKQSDSIGLQIRGDFNIVENSTFQNCGQLGIMGSGTGNKILNNNSNSNNTRGFNKWWEAGGMKFIGNGQIPNSAPGLKNSEIAGNVVLHNKGDGIWCDFCQSGGNKIHNNISAYNSGFGVHYEVSPNSLINDNLVFSNGQRGIYVSGSSGNLVTHNLTAFNGLAGIVVIERPKVTAPSNNKVYGNIMAWNTKASLRLPTEFTRHDSNHNLYLQKDQPIFSLGWSPIFTGLSSWRTKTGKDKNSLSKSMAPPSLIQQAISQKKVNIDWSSLIPNSAEINVPALSFNESTLNARPPGPQLPLSAKPSEDPNPSMPPAAPKNLVVSED